MNKIYVLVLIFCFGNSFAQTTAVPDPVFEQFLIDEGIDSDATINGEVLTSDIENITELNLTGTGIDDLSGLEDFTSLEILDISNLYLEEINLSGNPNLKEFYGAYNYFETLDLSYNTELEVLHIPHNLLTEINLSSNPLLVSIFVGNEQNDVAPLNYIQHLDLSSNPEISSINLLNSGVSSINLANGNNSINMWI